MKTKRTIFSSLAAILIFSMLAACAPSVQATVVPVTGITQPTASAPSQAAVSSTATSPAAVSANATNPAPVASTTTSNAASLSAKINLNTATSADFLSVPGVGASMVREFMEYRPYTSILVFEKEIGKYVSAAQVKQYEQYVYVPVNANTSDAATLMQISGLDSTEAAALIAGRPYASNDAFLAALAKVVSEAELAAAKNLLSAL
jgi:DNA uptake protein ComE-like DNA-binding protein